MPEDALVVEEVEVHRAPGFEDEVLPVGGLSPGINVIHGPNASGKSTLARATQWLLWPAIADSRARLVGQFSLDGEKWRVDVDAGGPRYQRDGQESSGPTLPPPDQRDRYHLALHDLLQHETRNEDFARTIERESAGGFDLAGARDDLGFDDSVTTRGKGEVRAVESAIQSVRDARNTEEALREDEKRLASLQREHEEAAAARERAELLDLAIDYAAARETVEEATAAIEDFPPTVTELDGSEAETVASLDEEIDSLEEKAAEAREAREEATKTIERAALPETAVEEGFIDRLKALRDDLRKYEAGLDDCEAALEKKRSQREKTRENIPLDLPESTLRTVETGDWEAIAKFAREAERVRAERKGRDAAQSWLDGEDSPDADRSTLQTGARTLVQWLGHPETDDGDTDSVAFRATALSAFVVAMASGLLGVLVHPVFFTLLVLAAVLGGYAIRTRPGSDGGAGVRRAHRESFEGLGLEPPDSWTEPDVRERLVELYDAIAAHRVTEERDQRREALTDDLESLAEREGELDERRKRLKERLGAAPETTDVELLVIVDGIRRWQDRDEQFRGLAEERDTVEAQLDAVRTELSVLLADFGYEEVTDHAMATQVVRDLENRVDSHDRAMERRERAAATISEATEQLDAVQSRREAIFTDLEPTEFDRLREYCEQVPAYEEAEREREKAVAVAEGKRRDLESHPDFEEELLAMDRSTLEERRRAAEKTAGKHDELTEEISEIQTKIDQAKRGNDVETALLRKDRALDDVGELLDADYASVVGHVLVEHLQGETSESSRPAVFERARSILLQITNGRYRLQLEDDDDTFRAYDTVKELGFALDELSSATQLQVLLAVRIAFVEHQEVAVRLPLLCDETLANTDDWRADVIIEALIDLASEGRQVLYFTAQRDEVARWKRALENGDGVDSEFVDLAAIRGVDAHVDVPDLAEYSPASSSPPAPDGHEHDSYGECLDVPPFDPRRGPGPVHLWYLVDDVDLLYRLLDLGVDRWGQLKNLLASNATDAIDADPETVAEVELTGRAMETFVRWWKRGRGKRVTREVLESSGAVSPTFIDDVTALARQVDGDGEAVIEQLRAGAVDRFRSGKTDELEVYFEENGYIDHAETVKPAELRVSVASTFVEGGLSEAEATERSARLIDRLTG